MQSLEQRRRSNQLISSIDVVGFLSVLLVLLYIVMAPSMMVIHPHGKDVDLAKVNHPVPIPGADRDDAMLIAITRDGQIYFGNDQIDLSILAVKIQERVRHGSPRVVYFKADARARYKYVRDAPEAVQTSGLENIAFLTEQRKTTSH